MLDFGSVRTAEPTISLSIKPIFFTLHLKISVLIAEKGTSVCVCVLKRSDDLHTVSVPCNIKSMYSMYGGR